MDPEFDPRELYRPPAAMLETALPQSGATPFYVVSLSKFLILFFGTCGMYEFYWFYKHWKCHQQATGGEQSPFWRTVFAIFFAHKLFAAFQSGAQHDRASAEWQAGGSAALFVVLTLMGAVLSRLSTIDSASELAAGRLLHLVGVILSLCVAFPMYQAQRVANVASSEPDGESNSTISGLNIVFVLIGGVLWLLVLIGIAAPSA